MANKKVFTDESLATLVDETKAYVDNAVSDKANSSHNHTASNITSGTLSSDRLPTVPIAKGGTGSTTAAGALTNLGITATASELNKMDGVTATTTELNYVDGVTSNIQTQLDGKSASGHGHDAATTSTNGFMSKDDKVKLDGITASADSVSFSRNLTSGTKVGTITINGNGTDLYAPTNTNTTYTFATGDSNGQIKVTPSDGTAQNISVKGLGSAAYTASTAYDAAGTATTKANTAEANAKSYTDTAISNLINSAPTTLDTLGEIATAMEENADVVEALESSIGNKVDKVSGKGLSTNDLTATLKSNYDAAYSHVSNKSNPHGVTLSQLGVDASATELNFCRGLDGVIQNQLDGKASSSHTHTAGSLGFGYATCSTAEATTAKIALLGSYVLEVDGIVSVKFTYGVPANSTLNINSKGAKAIYYCGKSITDNIIKAGSIATFIYDGTNYNLIAIDRWQEDISGKQNLITGGASTITNSNLTASRALVSNSSGKVAVSNVTSTELGYLDGVTSAIQTQLDGKADSEHTHSSYVNQNAFSNVTIGSTTIAADSTTDTLTFAGSNVTITPDATNDKITFKVADGTTSAKGVVQLTDSTNSTSTTTAATPNSVNKAYTLAGTANNTANSAKTTAESKSTVEASSTNGKIKIDGTDTTVYTHPTTAGNKHIPTGGSNGQVLKYSASGTATWGTDKDTTYSLSSGDNNGTIKITPSSGSAYNVAVKGLGSAAYTDSTSYASSSHSHDEYATKNNPTFTGDFNISGNLKISDITVNDFVVEEGGAGDWTFKRWNSGYLECWCSKQVTIAANPTAWGSSYLIKGAAINYPFEFASRPAQSATLYTADGSYWMMPNYNTTASTGTYYCVRPIANSSAITGVVSFIVKGSLV